jgi:hypothetical protein
MVRARRSRSSGVRIVFFLFLAIVYLQELFDLVELAVRVEQPREDSRDVPTVQRQLHAPIVDRAPRARKMTSRDAAAASWDRVAEAIPATPGALSEDVRRAIARGEDPPELASLLDKVRRHAYRIVDAEVPGHDEDAVLEATLAAALGVAL